MCALHCNVNPNIHIQKSLCPSSECQCWCDSSVLVWPIIGFSIAFSPLKHRTHHCTHLADFSAAVSFFLSLSRSLSLSLSLYHSIYIPRLLYRCCIALGPVRSLCCTIIPPCTLTTLFRSFVWCVYALVRLKFAIAITNLAALCSWEFGLV